MAHKLNGKKADAELLLVQAAIAMTRIKGKVARACVMVLVDGLTQAKAARKVRLPRQNIYRAVKRVSPELVKVRRYAESLK